MKNLKMFQKSLQAVIMISVVSLLVGCSDQLTSPPEFENSKAVKGSDKRYIPLADESLSFNQTFRTQIRLRPYASYTLNEANSGLIEFNAIDIKILAIDPYIEKKPLDCQDILVFGKPKDSFSLNCHSKGFSTKEILIMNKGPKTMDLEIQLEGVKKKISVPVDTE